jgi:uncharacterized membrane protein
MSENSMQSQSHIDSIVRQEEEALERRSSPERLADAVGVFAGSLFFVVLHVLLLVAWLLINSGKLPSTRPFDPYPFSLLGVIVAVEAVILSSFILMRQNRMMRRGERRDHLNLQVDLLAEKEITKLLQMVRALCGHMDLQNILADKEILARTPLLSRSVRHWRIGCRGHRVKYPPLQQDLDSCTVPAQAKRASGSCPTFSFSRRSLSRTRARASRL